MNLPRRKKDELLRNRPLCYRPVLRLDEDLDVSLKKMEEMGRVLQPTPPGIDCGVCGAPNCRAFAEDIVKGLATERRVHFIHCQVKTLDSDETLLYTRLVR